MLADREPRRRTQAASLACMLQSLNRVLASTVAASTAAKAHVLTAAPNASHKVATLSVGGSPHEH